ncbi:unconventional prefoldin RPB5 interactor 1 [Sardina pilchardus]|uniref:unconventional prefoldin RPB5 interactor 1 n=1 Tax=Sardina pilchardus TaxID=27697 RepID=UPI002E10B92A
MAGKVTRSSDLALDVGRLQEEHKKVVTGYESQIEHWQKVVKDYDSLQERLQTLPDQLSYDITVPFGPLAFMPGKLVHTNEVTVLLGDNWFAKCSAKQAQDLVEHRKKHVNHTLDDLHKTVKNFENRQRFTKDLEKLSGGKGDYVDIREEVVNEETLTKGKRRVAHKPHSKPKIEHVLTLEEEEEEEEEEVEVEDLVGVGGYESGDGRKGILSEEELLARLDALEAQEEQQDERDRLCDSTDTNGEDTSSSSEEEKEREGSGETNGSPTDDHTTTYTNGSPTEDRTTTYTHNRLVNGGLHTHPEEDEEEDEDDEGEEDPNALPTIYFCHTVEPKKVRINTGKNTMLKFSERKEQKEQAKKKKKNGKANNRTRHEQHKITSPADIYRLFVDVVNGELIPRKSILKSRSRENSVCSDTSESSAADFEERRSALGRTLSHDDTTHSDTSDCVTEEDSPPGIPLHPGSRFEAFSGTVVEKDPLPSSMPSSMPHLSMASPALPTILERKSEEQCSDTPQEPPKRVSKFKAARLQQK